MDSMIRSSRICLQSLLGAWLMLATAQAQQPLELDSGITRARVEDRSYLSYTTEVLDNLIEFGTDRYGGTLSTLLVSNIDVRTKNSVPAGEFLSLEEAWRVERRERRAPGGSNVMMNSAVFSTMQQVSQITGNPLYSNFVDANYDYALTNLVDDNGMLWWGFHRHYDVHTDQLLSEPSNNQHEMHFIDRPLWETMWNQNATAVQTEIEQIWNRHVVDKTTGQINRHDSGGPGLSFIMSTASFLDAFAFMSTKQPGFIPGESDRNTDTWIKRAKLLDDYVWQARDPSTNLTPHTSNPGIRWDQIRSTTTTPGVYVPALLKAFQATGDAYFRDRALAYLSAWDQYHYDAASGSFWGSLHLDGTPVPGPRLTDGSYEQYEPSGLIDMWAPEFVTAEHNPDVPQAYAEAYEILGEPALLAAAEHWTGPLRESLFQRQTLEDSWYAGYSNAWAPLGTYAEHYGRAIDFFVTMYDLTSDESHLFSARDYAKEAISLLWYDGLMRGHPGKPYYEALDGVGVLLESLLALDRQSANFGKFGDFDGDDDVDGDDYQSLIDNWLESVAAYENGDVTGDGRVTLLDFNLFKNEYFEGTPTTLGAPPIGVPEPGSLVLLLVGGAAFLRSKLRIPPILPH
jgi:pectate lyase-like protein/dockerin type I repeat protein